MISIKHLLMPNISIDMSLTRDLQTLGLYSEEMLDRKDTLPLSKEHKV